jgi:hypothetical protein
LFPSRSRGGDHIGIRQYARLVDHWVTVIDLGPAAYGAHSLRRTKVALVYTIEVDDALELPEHLEV